MNKTQAILFESAMVVVLLASAGHFRDERYRILSDEAVSLFGN